MKDETGHGAHSGKVDQIGRTYSTAFRDVKRRAKTKRFEMKRVEDVAGSVYLRRDGAGRGDIMPLAEAQAIVDAAPR